MEPVVSSVYWCANRCFNIWMRWRMVRKMPRISQDAADEGFDQILSNAEMDCAAFDKALGR